MASRGIHIILNGKSSHASEPEKGKSPITAFNKLIEKLEMIPMELAVPGSMITICHAKLGEPSFGVSPGFAEIQATIRSKDDNDMQNISEKVIRFITETAEKHKLSLTYQWKEEYPATISNEECVNAVRNAANETGLESVFISKPFRWSEDFSHFTTRFPGAFFGLGAGEDIAALHHPDYDFPDKLIKPGIELYMSLLNNLL
jgi:metal-dependent amidase/aminoacylase/carboxypeptidase family protein